MAVRSLKQNPALTHMHTQRDAHRDMHTRRHTNISNYLTHHTKTWTIYWRGWRRGHTQSLLLILLRNSWRGRKTSRCFQPSFSQAQVVFFLSSLQNPSSGTSKIVIMFQHSSIGSLSSLLYPFLHPPRPFVYSFVIEKNLASFGFSNSNFSPLHSTLKPSIPPKNTTSSTFKKKFFYTV